MPSARSWSGTGARHGRVRVHRLGGRARAGRRRLRGAGARRARARRRQPRRVCRSSGSRATSAIRPCSTGPSTASSTVFHLAAVYRFWAADPDLFYDVNIGGTHERDARRWSARSAGGSCTRARSARSASPHDGQPASEETLVHFEHLFGHYKRSKYLAEHEVLRAGAAGLPVVLVHPTFPVGEGDTAPTPTGRTIVEFLNGRIPAYVDTALNVVHVDDVARGHVLAARTGRARAGATSSAARTCRCSRCSRRSPTCAGSQAPRVRLSPRAVLPIVRTRRMVPVDGAAQRADAAVGAGAHGDDPDGVRRRAAPAPSSATRACRPATALTRAASWFVDHGFVKGPAGRAHPPRRQARHRDRPAGRADPQRSSRRRRPHERPPRAGPDASATSREPAVRLAEADGAFDVRALLEARGREAFALHERYVNPQMPRVLRTIGFDADYVRAEGAYLFDRDGRRYLDFLAGLRRVRARSLPSGDRAGAPRRDGTARSRTSCRWSARRSRACSPKRSSRACRTTSYRCFFTNSGAESVETVLKYVRCATGRSRVLFADHAFHGLTMGALSLNGAHEFRDRFGTLLPGCRACRSAISTRCERELRDGDVAAFVVEPIQGKGVFVAPDGYLRAAVGALSPSRRAARDRRGADRARAHGHVLRVRAVGRRARSRDASPRRCRAATCRSVR